MHTCTIYIHAYMYIYTCTIHMYIPCIYKNVYNIPEESEGAISDRHVTCASNSATETTHVTTEPIFFC